MTMCHICGMLVITTIVKTVLVAFSQFNYNTVYFANAKTEKITKAPLKSMKKKKIHLIYVLYFKSYSLIILKPAQAVLVAFIKDVEMSDLLMNLLSQIFSMIWLIQFTKAVIRKYYLSIMTCCCFVSFLKLESFSALH